MKRNVVSPADRGRIAGPATTKAARTAPSLVCVILLALTATGCPVRPVQDAGAADRPATVSEGGQTPPSGAALSVTGGEPVVYDCGDGLRATARYYSLSDGSLSFVRLELSDGSAYTLPALGSASGVRYTDDMQALWWSRGDTARFEKRHEDGEWRVVGDECREVGKEAP